MATHNHYNQIIIGKNYNIAIFAQPGFADRKPIGFWSSSTITTSRNCMPKWGKETENRANLVKEIRAYWVEKWFSKTVPAIKKALLQSTRLPEDIVEFLPEYFEYPYEIKSF